MKQIYFLLKVNFIIKHNELLARHTIKDDIGKLLSKYKRSNDSHEQRKSKTNNNRTKNNNLDCMIDQTFWNINTLLFMSFKNGDNDSIRNSFFEYYMSSLEAKDFNILINNKPFFDKPVRSNKKHMKNLLKC